MNWVREKLAERRAAGWLKRNKQTTTPEKDEATSPATVGSSGVVRRTTTDATNAATTTMHTPQLSAAPPQQLPMTSKPKPRTTSKQKSSRHLASSSSSSYYGTTSGTSVNNSKDNLDKRLAKERIKVRVVCPSARVLTFHTDVHKRLAELKNEVILELADDPASLPLYATDVRQLSPRYRLFRAEYQGIELNETLTMIQLGLIDNDMLVLVARRNQMQQLMAQARETRSPQQLDIETATRHIPAQLVDMPMVDINEIFQQSNLQFDVRKVLISLAQASAAIIGAGPYASRVIAMLKQKLINKRNYQNDTLQCLVDMGFKKEKAEYALKLSQGVYSTALEFLIQHQSADSDTVSSEDAPLGIQKSQSIVSPSGIISDETVAENVSALLEIVRIYSHREIPPNKETVSALMEMGFAEPDVMNALKKTCNNKAAACELLCGNRSDSLIELRDGLANDSPILKSILELPQVQLNLSNPKIFLAFLSILENENSIRVWGGDNDTTSVITHILQKYHEEKHVLGINQFYSNR